MKPKQPRDLTTEEWLDQYIDSDLKRPVTTDAECTAEEYLEAKGFESKAQFRLDQLGFPGVEWYRFVDFRTTKKGSVAMDFESIFDGTRVTKFFNVKLENNRGQKYPAGHRGQFIPPPEGDFRKFWMQAVGEEPYRWCRVHKSMRSKLRGLLFTGYAITETDRNGSSYRKLTSVWAL